jgi:hypothetical protein
LVVVGTLVEMGLLVGYMVMLHMYLLEDRVHLYIGLYCWLGTVPGAGRDGSGLQRSPPSARHRLAPNFFLRGF